MRPRAFTSCVARLRFGPSCRRRFFTPDWRSDHGNESQRRSSPKEPAPERASASSCRPAAYPLPSNHPPRYRFSYRRRQHDDRTKAVIAATCEARRHDVLTRGMRVMRRLHAGLRRISGNTNPTSHCKLPQAVRLIGNPYLAAGEPKVALSAEQRYSALLFFALFPPHRHRIWGKRKFQLSD